MYVDQPEKAVYNKQSAGKPLKPNFKVIKCENTAPASHCINIPVLTTVIAGIAIPVSLFKRINGNIEYDLSKMLVMGACSILGGLTGGLLLSKGKKLWTKIKEANFQFINLLIPMVLTSTLLKEANKYFPEAIGKYKNIAAKACSIVLGLGIGCTFSNYVSNKANNLLINDGEKVKRKCSPKDFLVHCDDIAAALTLSNPNSILSKFLPYTLILTGYQAGTKE